MGWFDHVNFKMKCPQCEKEITDFQTKDTGGFCDTVEYWECNKFYSICDYCHLWVEFILKENCICPPLILPLEECPSLPLEAYEMRIKKSSLKEENITRNSEGKITEFHS